MSDPQPTSVLSLEELTKAVTTVIPFPATSALLNGNGTLREGTFRRMGRWEYVGLMPPPPPESVEWPEAEWGAREIAWLEAQPLEVRERREAELRDVAAKVIALTSVAPRFTVAQARLLGDEAAVVAAAILRFSGLLHEPAQEPAPGA